MAAFERVAHGVDVADAFEGIIGPAAGQIDDRLDDVGLFLRVQEVGHAEFPRLFRFRRVDVEADDLVGAGHAGALYDVETDAAEAEHHDVGAWLDLGFENDRADARGDPAADVTDLVEGRVLAHLGHRDLRQDREVGEGGAPHVVQDRLAMVGEAGRPVGHHAFALGGANGLAEVRLRVQAELALPAFGGIERDHVIPRRDRGDAVTDLADDTRPLMTEDRRERPFRIIARQGEGIGVADAGRLDLDQDLAGLRPFEIDFLDDQRLGRLQRDGCACFHLILPPNTLDQGFRR